MAAKKRRIRKTLQNASRLKNIVGVFAKHGFYNIAEKVKLGQFIVERISHSEDLERLSIPERIRMSFEELGPTFVKLGQVLATRPDLVPEEYVIEFSKLHDKALPLSFETIEQVLISEFGTEFKNQFPFIDPNPIGSASIAQVHKAQLISGENIVIKVQRPGIVETINNDLNVLYFLAELLNDYAPEVRAFNPVGIVDEYFKTLELETNFVVEANNIRRFQENFALDTEVVIPKVYFDYTTEKVLVMEALLGTPLSHPDALIQPNIDREFLIKTALRVYMKMVFSDGLFHGDLHAGNFFILNEKKIGLVDFGVVGRLNPRTQTSIANMLLALSKEDYERLAHEYVDLAPFTDQVNIDLFAKDLREVIAPFYGLTLKNVNLGKILMNSSSVAARHGLSLPTELMLFFKSIVAIEGIGRKIDSQFDFLKYSLSIAGDMVKNQFEPNKVINDFSQVARESKALLNTLPRQINFLLKKLNSPDHSFQLKLTQIEDFKKSFEVSFNLLFLGVIIASLIISGAYIAVHPSEAMIMGLPSLAFTHYLIAMILGLVAFVNYIKKS